MSRNEFDMLDMLGVSKRWLSAPLLPLIESIPAARGVLPDLLTAHQGLFLPTKKTNEPSPEVVAIQDEQKDLDVRYDSLLHGGYWILTGLASLCIDDAERARFISARDQIFPDGIAGTQHSYRKEGDAATLLEGRLGGAERALLAQIPLPKNLTKDPTLLSAIEEHIEKGKRIGALEEEKRKKKQEAGLVSGPNAAEVRRIWLNAARTLEAVLGLPSVSEEHRRLILAPLVEAEEQYAKKSKAIPAPEPAIPVDPKATE